MTRIDVLRDLLDNGRDCDPPRLEAIAAELGHHVGAVFLAAVRRTTEQLVRAAREADGPPQAAPAAEPDHVGRSPTRSGPSARAAGSG
ncbi:hypothetical protein [Micromonospora echinaurantiaca]|uniref:hypothetical protein n=1 Tax=Micromonospora echinaurantiaca TaxID=47857 RepID=UPI0012FE30BB|nr:hypothetical protein [Micromonospora echinaurantiaca]